MTSFRGTTGSADTQPEKENKDPSDARHESKSAQHTENLTRGNLFKRQHSRSVIEQKEKVDEASVRSHPNLVSVFHTASQATIGTSRVAITGRILVFAPSFQTIILRTLIDQKIKKESPLSRGFFFCFFYTLCAVLTIVPAKGMLVVSLPPRLPIIALVVVFFFPSTHAFSRHPSLLCCIHPSRASTAYRPQRPDAFVGPLLYPHIHSCCRRRRCLHLHLTLSHRYKCPATNMIPTQP